MKFAIFGNTYQAKKSSHAENLFRLLGSLTLCNHNNE